MNPKGHRYWMEHCIDLASRGAGAVSPNPMVGAVLVGPEGRVLGQGWHAHYGGPHAEVHAIADAEKKHPERIHKATLYVNLEPCSHHGKTPPCTDMIIDKGIPRVVVGMTDPFPEVSGRGLARLKAHGIDVVEESLDGACRRFNEAFTRWVRTGRPLVTVKVAQTLDGQVATTTGDARWVSGEAARTQVHRWRAQQDAVLVGAGTALADDPALTVRHVEGRQPIRIVLDRTGSLPPSLQLFTDPFTSHTWVVVGPGVQPSYAEKLQSGGGRIWSVPEKAGHLDLKHLFDEIGQDNQHPIQSVIVEAGPGLSTALFAQDLVDRLFLFIAPRLIGGGIPALYPLGIEHMADAVTFEEIRWSQVGQDFLFEGYRRKV